jgi:hypothetical protein
MINNLLIIENKGFVTIAFIFCFPSQYENMENYGPIFQKWALPFIFGNL